MAYQNFPAEAQVADGKIIHNLGNVAGAYRVRVKAGNNRPAGTAAQGAFTLTPGANVNPVANAGADQNLSAGTTSATLTGTATDSDGTIASYSWTKVSGNGTIMSPAAATTTVTGLTNGASSTFRLTVTDNQGAIHTDEVTISVAAPVANVNPVANAGADQNLAANTTTATLNGTATDSDGTIASYAWSKISGNGTITSPSSASTTVTGLTNGASSVFRLTVTDNQGAVHSDDITVNVAVVAPQISSVYSYDAAGTGQNWTIQNPAGFNQGQDGGFSVLYYGKLKATNSNLGLGAADSNGNRVWDVLIQSDNVNGVSMGMVIFDNGAANYLHRFTNSSAGYINTGYGFIFSYTGSKTRAGIDLFRNGEIMTMSDGGVNSIGSIGTIASMSVGLAGGTQSNNADLDGVTIVSGSISAAQAAEIHAGNYSSIVGRVIAQYALNGNFTDDIGNHHGNPSTNPIFTAV